MDFRQEHKVYLESFNKMVLGEEKRLFPLSVRKIGDINNLTEEEYRLFVDGVASEENTQEQEYKRMGIFLK